MLLITLPDRQGNTRFNRLGKLLPDISTKMLVQTLHMLEAGEQVKRMVYPKVVPICVEYELTETHPII